MNIKKRLLYISFILAVIYILTMVYSSVCAIDIVQQAWTVDESGGAQSLIFRTITTPHSETLSDWQGSKYNKNADGWAYYSNNTSSGVFTPTANDPGKFNTFGFNFHTSRIGIYASNNIATTSCLIDGKSKNIGYNKLASNKMTYNGNITNIWDGSSYERISSLGTNSSPGIFHTINTHMLYRMTIQASGSKYIYISDRKISGSNLSGLLSATTGKTQTLGGFSNSMYVTNIMKTKRGSTSNYELSTPYKFAYHMTIDYNWTATARGREIDGKGSVFNLFDNILVLPALAKKEVYLRHINLGNSNYSSSAASSARNSNNYYMGQPYTTYNGWNIKGKDYVRVLNSSNPYVDVYSLDTSSVTFTQKNGTSLSPNYYSYLGYNISTNTNLNTATNNINKSSLDSTASAATIGLGAQDEYTVINMYYNLRQANVVERHISFDSAGNKVGETTATSNVSRGTSKTFNANTTSGYGYLGYNVSNTYNSGTLTSSYPITSTATSCTRTFTDDTTYINFLYKQNPKQVYVRHINLDTNEVINTTTVNDAIANNRFFSDRNITTSSGNYYMANYSGSITAQTSATLGTELVAMGYHIASGNNFADASSAVNTKVTNGNSVTAGDSATISYGSSSQVTVIQFYYKVPMRNINVRHVGMSTDGSAINKCFDANNNETNCNNYTTMRIRASSTSISQLAGLTGYNYMGYKGSTSAISTSNIVGAYNSKSYGSPTLDATNTYYDIFYQAIPLPSKNIVYIRHINLDTNQVISTQAVNDSINAKRLYSQLSVDSPYPNTGSSLWEQNLVNGYIHKEVITGNQITVRNIKKEFKELSGATYGNETNSNTYYRFIGYNYALNKSEKNRADSGYIEPNVGVVEQTIRNNVSRGIMTTVETGQDVKIEVNRTDLDKVTVIEMYYTRYAGTAYVRHMGIDKGKTSFLEYLKGNNSLTLLGKTWMNQVNISSSTHYNNKTYQEAYILKMGEQIDLLKTSNKSSEYDYAGYIVNNTNSSIPNQFSSLITEETKFGYTANTSEVKDFYINFVYAKKAELAILNNPETNIEGKLDFDVTLNCPKTNANTKSVISGSLIRFGIKDVPKYLIGGISLKEENQSTGLTFTLEREIKAKYQPMVINFLENVIAGAVKVISEFMRVIINIGRALIGLDPLGEDETETNIELEEQETAFGDIVTVSSKNNYKFVVPYSYIKYSIQDLLLYQKTEAKIYNTEQTGEPTILQELKGKRMFSENIMTENIAKDFNNIIQINNNELNSTNLAGTDYYIDGNKYKIATTYNGVQVEKELVKSGNNYKLTEDIGTVTFVKEDKEDFVLSLGSTLQLIINAVEKTYNNFIKPVTSAEVSFDYNGVATRKTYYVDNTFIQTQPRGAIVNAVIEDLFSNSAVNIIVNTKVSKTTSIDVSGNSAAATVDYSKNINKVLLQNKTINYSGNNINVETYPINIMDSGFVVTSEGKKYYTEGFNMLTDYPLSKTVLDTAVNGERYLVGILKYEPSLPINKIIIDKIYYSDSNDGVNTINQYYAKSKEKIEKEYKRSLNNVEKINVYTPMEVAADVSQTQSLVKIAAKVGAYQNGIYSSINDISGYASGFYIKFNSQIQKVKINGAVYKDGIKVDRDVWLWIPYIGNSGESNVEFQPMNKIKGDSISYELRAVAKNATETIKKDILKYSNPNFRAIYANVCNDNDDNINIVDVPVYYDLIASSFEYMGDTERTYNFRVTDLKDLNFKNVFRKTVGSEVNAHTTMAYYSGNKKWYFQDLAYINRTASEIGTNPLRTLPVGPYKNTDTSYVKAPKLGYRFSFDLRLTENVREFRNVKITPKFYYISKDGTKFIDSTKIYLFYKNSNENYVRVGDTSDTYKINFTPNDGYRLLDTYTESLLGKTNIELGTLSEIVLKGNGMSTSMGESYQTYYGEYKLPNSTIAVEIIDGKYDISKPLKDGYIGVRFFIQSVAVDGGPNNVLSYKTGEDDSSWFMEGFLNKSNPTETVVLNLEKGKWNITNDTYKKIDGTIVLYDTDSRASNDFN